MQLFEGSRTRHRKGIGKASERMGKNGHRCNFSHFALGVPARLLSLTSCQKVALSDSKAVPAPVAHCNQPVDPPCISANSGAEQYLLDASPKPPLCLSIKVSSYFLSERNYGKLSLRFRHVQIKHMKQQAEGTTAVTAQTDTTLVGTTPSQCTQSNV